MYDFFDMITLSAVTQEVIEALDNGQENAALEFAKHILSIDVPRTSTVHCALYTEENAVIRFVQWFLGYNQELGIHNAVEVLAQHTASFDYADTPLLTAGSVVSVLQMLNIVFPFSEKVVGDNPIEILLIESQHEYRNGESTAIFTSDRMRGSICIYQLQDDCIVRPEHILLHELGHLLHMKATGTLTDVPPGFKEYLSQLGTDCSKLSNEQLQEVFADTFMLAVISQTDALGDPLPQLTVAAKQRCFQYINQLLSHIPNA